jgi:predicted house-cleaning NTP pyrophosphatase (Maf/HAM1 superfamily)
MKGLGYKTAHAELCSVLGEQVYSLSRWTRRFKDGDLSYDHILHGTKLLVPDVLPCEQKSNQYHFLTAIALELSKEKSRAKRRVDKKRLVVDIDNSICHNGGKISEYFTREKRREFLIQFTPQISHHVTFGSSVIQWNERRTKYSRTTTIWKTS